MDYSTLSNEALLTLLTRQDPAALEQLYDRFSKAVYSVALRILREPALAEEVAQEVFLKVWRTPTAYEQERGSFIGWLLGVTRNRAIDEFRKRKRGRSFTFSEVAAATGGELPQFVATGRDPSEEALLTIQREQVLQALAELPDSQRRVLELAYFQGMSQSEISQLLGEPLGTVKTRTRLALQKLRGLLKEV